MASSTPKIEFITERAQAVADCEQTLDVFIRITPPDAPQIACNHSVSQVHALWVAPARPMAVVLEVSRCTRLGVP